jgi:hypothetical protein
MEEKLSPVDRVGTELIHQSICSADELGNIVKTFTEGSQKHFDAFLLKKGIVEKDQLLKILSTVYEVPLFDVSGYFFDHELLLMFPKEVLQKHLFIPVSEEGETLSIVMNDPANLDVLEEIGNYVSHNIDIQVGLSSDILVAIEEYYNLDVISDSVEDEEFQDDEENEEDADLIDFI